MRRVFIAGCCSYIHFDHHQREPACAQFSPCGLSTVSGSSGWGRWHTTATCICPWLRCPESLLKHPPFPTDHYLSPLPCLFFFLKAKWQFQRRTSLHVCVWVLCLLSLELETGGTRMWRSKGCIGDISCNWKHSEHSLSSGRKGEEGLSPVLLKSVP